MPKFIDSHPMGGLTPEVLKSLQNAPKDEYGVSHHDILYNQDLNKVFCVLDAPDEQAVRKHHAHAGLKCDFVQRVDSTRG